MFFLVQFGKLQIFFKDHKLHEPVGLLVFEKNLLVVIYSKLQSKSCDYQH